jgi:hypothetical protein
MKTLIFGLPGSGKSTLVKASKMPKLQLDLGHNAFKSESEREKFYEKLRRFTSQLLLVPGDFIMDTYPEYFDLEVVKTVPDVRVVYLLPEDALGVYELVRRVGDRDGRDSDFYQLYHRNALKWYPHWIDMYTKWRRAIPKRVFRQSIYVNESNGIITVTKEGDKK